MTAAFVICFAGSSKHSFFNDWVRIVFVNFWHNWLIWSIKLPQLSNNSIKFDFIFNSFTNLNKIILNNFYIK